MKLPIELIIAAIFISYVSAEEKESHGFLNVVNLVPSNAAVHITLAGKPLVPHGLKASAQTGWFMIPYGSVELKAEHAGYKTHRERIRIDEGVSQVIVISPQFGETKDVPAMNITSFPAYASKGHGIKAVSLIENTHVFQFSNQNLELEYLKISEIPNWTGNAFEIKHAGKKIGWIDRSRERASHYLLLASNQQGEYLTALVNADIQRLPAWHEN